MGDTFEKTIKIHGAFDRRHSEPSKNYGIHGCEIVFLLKGELGAVDFNLYTDWNLPEVQREMRRSFQESANKFDKIEPMGAYLNYHSPKPIFDGQEKMASKCEILNGDCYFDGSALQASEMIPDFLVGGSDYVWEELERRYNDMFLDEDSNITMEDTDPIDADHTGTSDGS